VSHFATPLSPNETAPYPHERSRRFTYSPSRIAPSADDTLTDDLIVPRIIGPRFPACPLLPQYHRSNDRGFVFHRRFPN
jgi:hypothetical protein